MDKNENVASRFLTAPIIGHVVSLVCLSPIPDVITDIWSSISFFTQGHTWWATISVFILYFNFRFTVLFALFHPKPTLKNLLILYSPGFILAATKRFRENAPVLKDSLKTPEKKIDHSLDGYGILNKLERKKIPWKQSPEMYTGDEVNFIFPCWNIRPSRRPQLLLNKIDDIFSTERDQTTNGYKAIMFVLRLFVELCLEICIFPCVVIAGPLIISTSSVNLCLLRWKETTFFRCQNRRVFEETMTFIGDLGKLLEHEKQTIQLYQEVVQFVESVLESLPQVLLQSRVFWYYSNKTGGSYPAFIFIPSVVLGVISILKSTLIFIIHHKKFLETLGLHPNLSKGYRSFLHWHSLSKKDVEWDANLVCDNCAANIETTTFGCYAENEDASDRTCNFDLCKKCMEETDVKRLTGNISHTTCSIHPHSLVLGCYYGKNEETGAVGQNNVFVGCDSPDCKKEMQTVRAFYHCVICQNYDICHTCARKHRI